MKVITSYHSGEKVFHIAGCHYVRRISDKYRMDMSRHEALVQGLRPCRCCCSLKGSIAAFTTSLENSGRARNLELTHNNKTKTLYIRTANGFWKTYWKNGDGLLLYHLNKYDAGKSTEELCSGPFHRQCDVKATYSMETILNYVEQHDKAMVIIADDYRKLPQKTKKQKMYFKKAKRRYERMQVRRVYDLFEALDREREEREKQMLQCVAG